MRLAPFTAALALAIAGCGQKGPLYLRDDPPPGYKPKTEVHKPVPYPEPRTGESTGK